MTTAEIAWHGETLELLPQRAIWWPRHRTLLVADVHLGKDQVFRRHGIGVPRGPTEADLDALDALLAARPARRLIVLGDLVHAPPAPADDWPPLVAAWRSRHAAVAMDVVLGNHDRRLAPWLETWRIGAAPALELGPFLLRHEPGADARPVLCGHLHPVVRLREGRRGSFRLPVFWFAPRQAVLPSFGAFTGGLVVEPRPEDAAYAVTGRSVIPLAGATARPFVTP